MSKPDYSNLDAALLAAVMTGCHRLANFENDTAVKRAVREVDAHLPINRRTGHARPAHRTIDARLQALKRAHKLEFFPKYGWRLKDKHA